MRKSKLTMLELKEKLIQMKKDEGEDGLYPYSLNEIGVEYQMINYSGNLGYEGSIVVYVKEGMAVMPVRDDNLGDFLLEPELINMIDENVIKSIKRQREARIKEIENLDFILEKQKIRMLFIE